MALLPFPCAYCGQKAWQEAGAVNRAYAKGLNLYCGRECSGLGRRKNRSDAEKRALKSAYDAEYRSKNRARLKAEKAAYYQRTRDPEKERIIRKANMARHVEYCRRPEYRRKKADYDRRHRAQKFYGPFAEAALVLNELETEIARRASRYEIAITNGTLNKHQQRRRDYERQTDRR